MTTVSMITIPSTNKSSFPCQNLALKPFLPSSSSASSSFVSLRRKPSFSCTLFLQKKSKTAPIFKTHVSAQDVVEATEDSIPPLLQDNQKLGVVVKPMEKPRVVLKFIWMEKNIGLALDQVIPGHGTIPLSPYYFWPRKDAWEELKTKLESKPWISQKRMIILLNQATDIINLWQQSGGNLS
ncbi:hypothetical protein MRB53_029963 [Persea americana]|uniref:Uncharacterized protein n=1 Tax=Persea americana TaxID=3435 RepID=A0ACC2KKD7_PERAE|nr:hypothetical protein MRB53_029963 [Persea americana]|eukprot:TRINITY_DN80218_c0_g1_i1.p1 TRINITY_DN80218_c0_g1~~TRINITY_DN80218_c0_g1_i1.p1  ORF type:complete len:182 (-),score=36.23 TRINITY_DN80218_c0_g1_i1:139-684(-)